MKTSRPSRRWWLPAIVGLLASAPQAFAAPPADIQMESLRVKSPELESNGDDGCCGKFEFGPDYSTPVKAQISPPAVHNPSAVSPPPPLTPAAVSFTNSTAITITDCPNPCPASGSAASLYPSSIVVAGLVGVVQRVTVKINGFSHAFPADTDFLLVSPSGRKVILMSDFGAGSPGVAGINVTFDDYADRPIPSTVTGNTGSPFVSGSYRPANSGTTDLFPAPAPAGPYAYALSHFNGSNPNGVWSLYIIDDANLDGGSISGGWTLTFDVRPPAPAAGDVLISEFRTRGAGTTPPASDGSADEFIELYNNTDESITIIDAVPGADPTSVAGAGWRLGIGVGAAESNFVLIPQTSQTAGPLAIPPRGHFLVTVQPAVPSPAGNTYSLATYPTGTGITASGSNNLAVDPPTTAGLLPDNSGLGLFSTSSNDPIRLMDAVGVSAITNASYKEGPGLATATGVTTPSQHSWIRKRVQGIVQDTGNNADDFQLVETSGAILNGIPSILGAPGPERGPTNTAYTTTSAPIHARTLANMLVDKVDPAVDFKTAPNAVLDATPVTNGSLGTIKLRAKFTNLSGANLIALRYRVFDMTTRKGGAPPTGGKADLRLLNSPAQTITLTDLSMVNAQALTLQTPAAQASGGGLNSSMAEGVITTTAPLANGASTVVEFNLGVEQYGDYTVGIIVEGLNPQLTGVSGVYRISGKVSANPAEFTAIMPISNTDRGFTNNVTKIDINVLGNDTIVPGQLITIETNPAHGTATVVNGKIRYTPNGPLPVGGDSFTYRYNGEVATVFIYNYSNVAGAFDGLVTDPFAPLGPASHERNGRVSLNVSLNGAYTGSFYLGGVLRSSLSGTLGVPGAYAKTITRAPEVPIFFSLTADAPSNTIGVNVQSTDYNADSFTSTVNLQRRTANAALAKSYTYFIRPTGAPKTPQGTGYASVKISTTGDITLAGKLADGAPISLKTVLLPGNVFPIYLAPYPKTAARGSLYGTVFFSGVLPVGVAGGTLVWYKWPRPGEAFYPNGIFQFNDSVLAEYTPPPTGTRLLGFDPITNNGLAKFIGGGIPTINQLFTLATTNKTTVAPPNTNKVSINFSVPTGTFTGSFLNPVSKKATPISGAVIQQNKTGAGFFRGAGPFDGGAVTIEKAP